MLGCTHLKQQRISQKLCLVVGSKTLAAMSVGSVTVQKYPEFNRERKMRPTKKIFLMTNKNSKAMALHTLSLNAFPRKFTFLNIRELHLPEIFIKLNQVFPLTDFPSQFLKTLIFSFLQLLDFQIINISNKKA